MNYAATRREPCRGWATAAGIDRAMPLSGSNLWRLGIPSADAELLGYAGVRTVQDLASQNPTLLVARVGRQSGLRFPKRLGPGAARVADWVVAARADVDGC